ncbi:MAG: acetyl-CoA carboxylase carboxyl transferase subunit beta, partial [Polyangiaceae bacterium]|nr:acetyl-CoA carboxylase carboxyl transferase subunit beta [Polyangiaceae bacterium]
MAFPSRTPPQANESEKKSVGKGVFSKCKGCGEVLTAEDFATNWNVCGTCGYHHPMGPGEWQKLLLDDGKLNLWDEHLAPADPLLFNDGKSYKDRVKGAQEKNRLNDAMQIGHGKIDGQEVGYGLFVFRFMGGSMGSVV